MSEEQITLSRKDLEELIDRKVREQLSRQRVSVPVNIINSNYLFSHLKENRFEEVHLKHEFSSNVPWRNNWQDNRVLYNRPLSVNYFTEGTVKGSHRHLAYGLLNYQDVYDLLRKTTLSVMGVSLNNQLSPEEYKFAQYVFKEFQDLYYILYEKRINQLAEENHWFEDFPSKD